MLASPEEAPWLRGGGGGYEEPMPEFADKVLKCVDCGAD